MTKKRGEVIIGESLQAIASLLVQSPSDNQLAEAVTDLQKRFEEDLTPEQLVNCMEYLRMDTTLSVIWNKLNYPAKQAYIEKWKGLGY